jgi:stearoyl-CoA desaturase (delta-9 desaturase)
MASLDSWAAFVDAQIQWLAHGLSGFSGLKVVADTLLTTHVTVVAVTVFLHRSQAHRTLDFIRWSLSSMATGR